MKRRQLWAGLALAVAFVLIGLGSAYIAGPTALQAAPAAEVAAPPPPTPAAKKPPQRPDAQEQAAPDSQLPPQRSGGPDAYGYTYDDSSEPGGPLFNWIAATQVISALHGGDDVTTTITLPFPINFYGATYNNTVVSTNGNLHMFAGGANDFSPPNCLPDPNYTLHLGLIAPFWDDMSFVGQGDVYTSVVGLVPNRTFVIEWRDANLFRNDGAHLTYEVLIDENSDNTPNVIRYQYLSLTGVAAGGTGSGDSFTPSLPAALATEAPTDECSAPNATTSLTTW